jgi:hypothetical protein
VPQESRAEGHTALPKAGAKREREATDLIAFVFLFYFSLRFPPKNRMSSPNTI